MLSGLAHEQAGLLEGSVDMDGLENTTRSSETGNFQTRFCARFKCPPEEFDRRVLWKCIYPWALPLARLLWVIRYGHFEGDLDLIEEVKLATTYEGARNIVLCSDGTATSHWLRRNFKVRMSRSRLLGLVRSVLELEAPVGPAAAAPEKTSLNLEKNLP